MKIPLICIAALLSSQLTFPAPFTSGSTGMDLDLDVAANTTRVLPQRTDGIFNYQSIRVRQGARLQFERNEANTPIYLLATHDVLIEGTVDVTGKPGSALNGGEGGPGGFDGGKPGIGGGAPGAGYGPGGGKGGGSANNASGAGGGSYAIVAAGGLSTNKGARYGSSLLMPLVGGSGGGGMPNLGGAGGGGAILIASTTRIRIASTGSILAHGAATGIGYGSGGAIRLVAPEVAGNGRLNVTGNTLGGEGRIRIDLVDRSQFDLQFTPSPVNSPETVSVGGLLAVFPPVTPQLEIVSVGGEQIVPGTGTPVFVRLPFGANANQIIELQARDFNQSLAVTLALIPDSGSPSFYNTTIDNITSNPSVRRPVTVSMPANVIMRVMAWTH